MVASILGTLKSGMTYVPLDSSHPRERLATILKDCSAKYLIADEANASFAYELIYSSGMTEIEIIDVSDITPLNSIEAPLRKIEPQTEAYIMYTSGSTGSPKGLFQSHRNVLKMCTYFGNEIDICVDD